MEEYGLTITHCTQVETAKECANQCADEAQCNGWSHFAPAKR